MGHVKIRPMVRLTTLTAAMAVTYACGGVDPKGERSKSSPESETRRSSNGDSFGPGFNLALPAATAADQDKPITVTPALKNIFDQGRKDPVIEFTCDKETGKTKGMVYIALYQRSVVNAASDRALNDILAYEPDILDASWLMNDIQAKPAPVPGSSNSGGVSAPEPSFPTPMPSGPVVGFPMIGGFSTAMATPPGSNPNDAFSLGGNGILVAYTCDQTSKINVNLYGRGGFYNVYVRTFTAAGRATHNALSGVIKDTDTSVTLNLKKLQRRVEVIVK